MSDYKVTDSELISIANAIRTKGGTSSPLAFPNGFTSAVEAIPAGGSSILISKSITANGTYNASSDNADGYSAVTVNVSGSGGGSGSGNSITISQNDPTIADGDINDLWVKYSTVIFSDLISQTLTRKYKIVITAAARNTDYSFNYYGARELEFIFDDGNGNDVLLQDIDSNFSYSGSLTKSNLFDKSLSNYTEANGIPATMVMSLTVPAGYTLKGFRVGWRNDNWKDFWRTFTLTETFVDNGVEYERTVLKKENTTIDDWNVGAYVDFTNDMHFDNFIVTDLKQYMKLSTGWTEIESLIDYVKHILQ